MNQILSEFEKTIEKFPDCVETYALSAQVLNDQQEFARADELYKKAMTKDPQNANLLVHRYTIHIQVYNTYTGIQLRKLTRD